MLQAGIEDFIVDTPLVSWDYGTAYDMFVSLHMLHQPEHYHIPATWASGMRSRLPSDARETLEHAEATVFDRRPTHWVYTLPPPKDGDTVLRALAAIPPLMRLPILTLRPDTDPEVAVILMDIAERGGWDSRDLTQFRTVYRRPHCPDAASVQDAAAILSVWADAAAFGERYLTALTAYHEAFFAEEERRIRPALDAALERAQALARELDFPALIDALTADVGYDILPKTTQVVLAPSYWVTPQLFVGWAAPDKPIYLFGARPLGASLVPGAPVSDALVETLKALGDPTRLRILQLLAAKPQTPTQLAGQLRLRAATVTHHLKQLQSVGLVRVRSKAGKERVYGARPEAVATTFETLREFIESSGKDG